MKVGRRIRLGLAIQAVMSLGIAAGASAQDPPPQPVVAYWTSQDAVLADADGQTLALYPDFAKMSLGGGVLAGEMRGRSADDARIVAFDAATRDRLYRISEARLPVVAGDGRKVAFLPTFERDNYGLSVWMRMSSGRIRKIAQFKTRGVPGIRHGMTAGVSPLDIAFDKSGRHMALVGGLETVRSFDVWMVDTKTKEATRITRGENSHNPSVTPEGARLAVRVERPESCPDPIYGEILIGKIRVIDLVSGDRRDLTEFSCDLFYDTPRWIDEDTLVAVRVTKDATEEFGYDLDVVSFDAATGEESALVTEGNPCCLSVSAGLGKIAYAFSDRDGFSVYDLATGTVVDFPGDSLVPHLSGENRF